MLTHTHINSTSQEFEDQDNDEALKAWELGKSIGMRSSEKNEVIKALRRSQRKQ